MAAVPDRCSTQRDPSKVQSGGPRITRKVRAGACHWLGELASSFERLVSSELGFLGFFVLLEAHKLSSIPDRLGWAAAELEACFATDADWKVSDFLTAGEVES